MGQGRGGREGALASVCQHADPRPPSLCSCSRSAPPRRSLPPTPPSPPMPEQQKRGRQASSTQADTRTGTDGCCGACLRADPSPGPCMHGTGHTPCALQGVSAHIDGCRKAGMRDGWLCGDAGRCRLQNMRVIFKRRIVSNQLNRPSMKSRRCGNRRASFIPAPKRSLLLVPTQRKRVPDQCEEATQSPMNPLKHYPHEASSSQCLLHELCT